MFISVNFDANDKTKRQNTCQYKLMFKLGCYVHRIMLVHLKYISDLAKMKLISSLTNATFYYKANIVCTQPCSDSAEANQRAILNTTLIISISNKNGPISEPPYLFKNSNSF